MKVRHLAVLLLLAEAPDRMDFTAAAYDLRLPKSAMTRSCDALDELGLVDREYSQDDARKIFLGITEQGREFVESMGVQC
jgi:DNA-binding MarR family transcriptional regulator